MSEAAAGTAEEFIVTKEYRRFAEFCDACQRDRYIGLCYGPPGVGKTLSARHYSQWDVLEAVRPGYFWPKPPPIEATTWRTVFHTAPVTGNPGRIEREVRELRSACTCSSRTPCSPVTGMPPPVRAPRDRIWLNC